ncbi:hypothetical protein C8Q74DRAFT_1242767 [Fomes fomentarius]|nr:hypothetical protein C8Q74DRAFT_1242767 [Fomes fomentarius]
MSALRDPMRTIAVTLSTIWFLCLLCCLLQESCLASSRFPFPESSSTFAYTISLFSLPGMYYICKSAAPTTCPL